MRRNVFEFRRAESGQASVLFALALVPLLLAAGAAIDYVNANRLRTEMQSALDAAAMAMATASSQPDSSRIKIGEQYFANNLVGTPLAKIEPAIAIGDDTIRISAKYNYPTAFMMLGGIDHVPIREMSEVMRPFAGTAEVVLVLDYSLSMNDKNKYSDMADAATAMIDDLSTSLDSGKLKVGLVPFSAMVYTSMSSSYVTQSSATSTWTGCTQDRRSPYNTTVDTPTSVSQTKWGYIDSSSQNTGSKSCSYYSSKNLKIAPLTTDTASLTAKLAAMVPIGYTNISLGAEFGWNLLDPQLPYDEAAPYTDKNTRKFMVLLTDGVQTTPEYGSDGSRSVANAQANLTKLCNSMRGKGITIFTIAYDVTDPAVTDLLKSCAPGRYFEPDAGGSEISMVFNQIKNQIKNRVARVAK